LITILPCKHIMRLASRPGTRKNLLHLETGRPAMLTRIFALTLALLSVTTSARAAVLAIDDINLSFGNGYTISGETGF
jgi:hypothetical protein